MKHNISSLLPESRSQIQNSKSLSPPPSLSYEEQILNSRKVTIPEPFTFYSPNQKQKPTKFSDNGFLKLAPSQKSLKKQKNPRLSRRATLFPKPCISPIPQKQSPTLDPQTNSYFHMKSSIKNSIIGQKSEKKVKFHGLNTNDILNLYTYQAEDIKSSFSRLAFYNIKQSVRKSPTVFQAKEHKKLKMHTIIDLMSIN